MSTFGILALELALIRWMSGQIRILAYFNNLILIGCFLGMGLGLVAGRRWPGLVHLTLPALLALCFPIAFATPLGLVNLPFPDASVYLWGAESVGDVWHFLRAYILILGLFSAIVGVFFLAGSATGHLFSRAAEIRGYSADLLGSLIGVIVMAIATASGSTPPVWLLVGGLPFAFLSGRLFSLAALVGVVVLGQVSVQGASFSPYNRIDVQQTEFGLTLAVNRDFHQYMHDFSQVAPGSNRDHLKRVYDIPFVLTDKRDGALVVGAGTGNDVRAGLRNGFQSVTSVDIDGRIIDLGRQLHPEKPYSDPRAVPVVNDARAFFEQYQGAPYDVICYGFVDSHAMFSALGSLRLDNYLYTEEGIRAAWKHVGPNGHLTVALSLMGGPWLASRLYWTIANGTGVQPVMVNHGAHGGATFVASKPGARPHWDRAPFPMIVSGSQGNTLTARDDWPFLYIRPDSMPWGYISVLGAVLLIAFGASRVVFGGALRSSFHLPLFLMGAAFLLIETRGVTSLSLLFGSTWIVNAAVFGGVLAMALAANMIVGRYRPVSLDISFALLLVSVVAIWAIEPSTLFRLPLVPRGVLGGLFNALPVAFAGVIVSAMLAQSRDLPGALGSNLLGSVVGGCLEYAGMGLGLRAVVLLALAIYLGAYHFWRRSSNAALS